MGLTIRHATQSNVADEGVAGEIGPTEWNEGHTITDGEPIVILATGQSNFVQTPAFAWSPESRARLWNYNHTDGNIGTAFVALPSTTINVTDKFASEVARLNPTRSVYLINTAMAFSGNTDLALVARHVRARRISADYEQRPGGAGGDRRDQDRPVAVVAGRGADAGNISVYQYPTDWETFHGRLLLETWFPRATPVIIFGLAPTTDLRLDRHRHHEWEVAGGGARLTRIAGASSTTGSLGAQFLARHVSSEWRWAMTRLGKMVGSRIRLWRHTERADRSGDGACCARRFLDARRRAICFSGEISPPIHGSAERASSRSPNGQFAADRWRWTQAGAGVVDITKTADAPTIAQAGTFTQHCLDIAVTTADASIAATDQYFIRQILEGLNTAFLGFGQAGARPITISFWVKSTKTGTFWLSIRNAAGDRSYATSYVVNTAEHMGTQGDHDPG